ncbi:NFX1-type zinc finger-containing protein 1 [Desmophyllum pertusum]|uniref:NFX1-type zinc finger-containing protein 1 n=1 Tax=Desmophyllum pertusum TaxID=174260 RepID=A0A9W9ZGA2_9CNID|nr:NFX1-type zinc finger-containing protein 1 [Desmophyllum pertusum]
MSQRYRKPAEDLRSKLDATLHSRKREAEDIDVPRINVTKRRRIVKLGEYRAEDVPRTDVTKLRRIVKLGEYRAEDVPTTDVTKRRLGEYRAEDVPKINFTKLRRTELREGTSNTTRSIGFKELENICREGVPENGILGLANKAQMFEALLVSEEIRPDLMKLVISAFRLLCSANRNLMTENAEKLLRSPIAKTFMTGTVLSRFINEMPHSECWKDENDRVSVISDLTEIFLALIPRFGESIVHTLPLAQLSTSLEELKENNLIKDTGELDKKVQQIKELKNEQIFVSGHFFAKNITDRKFKDLDHYLDVQFRLLREDFVMPLRNGIKQLTKESNSLETSPASKRANDVSVYHDVTVLYPVPNKKGRVYRIRFNLSHPKVKKVNWERSKRLKFGSLVCLSSDEFNTLVFATIENRDADGLKVGELEVRFENVEKKEINLFITGKEKFVMIESPAYFEAYRHVLEALKEIKPDEFPSRSISWNAVRTSGLLNIKFKEPEKIKQSRSTLLALSKRKNQQSPLEIAILLP